VIGAEFSSSTLTLTKRACRSDADVVRSGVIWPDPSAATINRSDARRNAFHTTRNDRLPTARPWFTSSTAEAGHPPASR
jgi:hypothetical protein